MDDFITGMDSVLEYHAFGIKVSKPLCFSSYAHSLQNPTTRKPLLHAITLSFSSKTARYLLIGLSFKELLVFFLHLNFVILDGPSKQQ